MRISICINSVTTICFDTYKVLERELFEPIFDGNKFNFKTYTFYFLYKVIDVNDNFELPNLKEFPRLYHRSLLLEPDLGEKYMLIRSVSDDIIVVEDAIKKLKTRRDDQSFSVINNDIDLKGLRELDEYNLGRFLDTEIDRAMIPFS